MAPLDLSNSVDSSHGAFRFHVKRYFAYCRTSTENQREEKTIDIQVDALTEFARREKIEIVGWFKDDGVSGGIENRPELGKLMRELETEKDIRGIVIYKLDRLARDLYIQEGLIKEFAKLGKDVVSTLEPDLASSDPSRKLLRQLLGAFAEFEKAMITLRMRNGRNNAVSKGGWHGGQVYGYDNKEGKLVVNEHESQVVKRIYYLKRYKKMSPYQIAKLLRHERVQTKRKNTKWRTMTVERILKNKLYRGYVSYNGKLHKGNHDIIIKI